MRKFKKIKTFSYVVMQIPSFPEGKRTDPSKFRKEGNRLPLKVCLARKHFNIFRQNLQ